VLSGRQRFDYKPAKSWVVASWGERPQKAGYVWVVSVCVCVCAWERGCNTNAGDCDCRCEWQKQNKKEAQNAPVCVASPLLCRQTAGPLSLTRSLSEFACICICVSVCNATTTASFLSPTDGDSENRASETDWLPSQPGICICIASPLHSQVSRTRKRPCENIATTNLELYTQTVKETLTNNTFRKYKLYQKPQPKIHSQRWKSNQHFSQNSIQDRSPRIRRLQHTLDYIPTAIEPATKKKQPSATSENQTIESNHTVLIIIIIISKTR